MNVTPNNVAGPVVFLVDDDAAVLKALSRLLRAHGRAVRAFSSAAAFLEACDGAAHGCLILDVSMPELDGLELQAALAARGCNLPIIFLTGRGDIPISVRAMKQGAADFLTKPARDEDLLAAVDAAIRRDQQLRETRVERAEMQKRMATLTPREREVFECVVSGMLNKQTASELGTVEKTIKVHRAHVMEKMQVESVADLVRIAERAGIQPRPIED